MKHLSKSDNVSILITQLFEDTFPAEEDLADMVKQALNLNLNFLEEETHHGKGLTPQFCDLEKEATKAGKDDINALRWQARRLYGIPFLPFRAGNTFYTWSKLKGQIRAKRRQINFFPFQAMPVAMADMHTEEGRDAGRFATVLSGTYNQHFKIYQIVQAQGWEAIWEEVFSEYLK